MKNINKTGLSDFKQEKENNPEKEKIREIIKRSKQFIVVCGPSGCGKTMAIKHLVDSYGFIEPPFLTTRKLRPEEGEIGGIHVSKDEFIEKEMDKKILLPQNNRSYIYY